MKQRLNARLWGVLSLFLAGVSTTWSACDYSISPSARTHGHGAATNTVAVITGTNCAWSVSNTNTWITILSGASGSHTGLVTYAVAANSSMTGRTGLVTIAGELFTVQQSGVPCSYSISPGTRTHGPGAATNSISITTTTNCAWSIVNTSVWINFTGATAGSGSNSAPYTVAPNNAPIQRTGVVVVADEQFILIQRAASCLYELSPTNRSHGHAGSTGLVSVSTSSNCVWAVENTNGWISITANPSGTGSGTFGYLVAANPTSSPRQGTFRVWNEVFTVFQQPAPCSYFITPSSANVSAEPGTNTVTVTAVEGCAWGVTNTNAWITVAPTNGLGDGVVTWRVLGHAGGMGRTGVVMIAGKSFTVRQDPAICAPKISPTNRVHGYGAATNSVTIDTLSVCAWNVVNTNGWVTIHSPTNGSGDATVHYSVSAHSGAGDRSGVVLIAGQQFTVAQRGIGCSITLSPSSRNHGHGTATNTITVSAPAGCGWEVVNANPWVRILGGSSLSGGGVVTYAVDANPSATERSGILEIGEQIFTITQSGVPCTYALTPGMRTHGHGAASNAFTITAAAGCSWQVGNTNGWITIASGASGSGDGTVGYRVEANPFPEERFGRLTIEGETFIITQRAAVCSFALSPTMRNHGYGATTGSVTVMTLEGCDWAVVNTNTWITITSGTSGSGHGVVNYTVAANNVTAPRSGTITIGDALFSVSQSALNCTYKLSPTNRNHGFGSTTGSVSVTAGPGCAWTVATTNHWISFTSAPNGTGNGTIGYSIPANFGHTARAGAITLNDEHALVITQDAAGNAFSFRWLRLQNGQVSVRLDGGPAGIWELQSSTNLATWTRVADLTNTTGRVEFTTPAPAGPRRFYRAILP